MTILQVNQTKANNTNDDLSPQQAFYDEYRALCDKHGYMINVMPTFKPGDNGTWSMVLQVSIAPQPKS